MADHQSVDTASEETALLADIRAAELNAYRAQALAAIMTKPVFVDAEVAQLLHLPLSTYFALRHTLNIPSFKLGKKRLTRREDLMAWINAQAEATR